MTTTTSLSVRDLRVRYGGVTAVDGVNLDLPRGAVVALIGSNGAGKTSVMNAVMNLAGDSSGTRVFNGNDISKMRTDQIVGLGMALVPEGRRLFPYMTVAENLTMGAYLRRDSAAIQRDRDRVLEVFPALREKLNQPAMSLSGGQQQMVAIGRALMSSPRLLLLDEPTIGLAPAVVDLIGTTIRAINRDGVDVLLVEQNASVALDLASYAYVIDDGNVVMQGSSETLKHDNRVQAAYLGL
ncbi:branched chain amino acid ABC transporter ATPase [Caballeronia turbans]|uniref:ABC transporter ATP-binding protein n=1 Tax=Caballeronia sp. INML2 TaxID=2921748 RepID=UPI00074B59D1|nr:ABC transporter ATP-binding protein [Caballeronia sp. INML2]SAL61257.1 branched chain amino acid ABC transporter ATPase [Caballeronia turbans]